MRLSEFGKNAQTNQQKNFSSGRAQNAAGGELNAKRAQNLTAAYEELKGCSSEELMQRLASEVQAQKQSGKFDYRGLRAAIEKMRIYLPENTYQNMLRIVDSLK